MLTGQTQSVNNIRATRNGLLLKNAHLLDLKNSGLSDDTIRVSAVYSADADEVKAMLRFSYDVGPGLVFPYPGVLTSDGRPFCRVKPDKPPIINGDPAKYLTPEGEGNHIYFPPNLPSNVLADPSVSLLVTEGEKKALKACQEGFSTIALSGVYCFKDKIHNPIPDINCIDLQGRLSYIGFDSDIIGNRMGQKAEWELAMVLHQRGAMVIPLRFPHGKNGEKVGLDDYLILAGPDQLKSLMAECENSPLTRLLREEYALESIRATEGISISKAFADKHPFYLIRPLTTDLTIRIEDLKEKNGNVIAALSAYRDQRLLNTDSINVIRERERGGFIKKLNLEPDLQKILLEKMNHLPRIAKELMAIQRLRREADDWVEKVGQQSIGSSTSTIPDAEKDEALKLLQDPALLYRISKAIEKLGVAGEKRNGIIIYLATTSRIQARPISLLIKGESASGKSFLVGQVTRLFPPDSYKELTGMSKQALIYSDESISHKTIVIFEKHGMDQALYNIRSLQSENKLIFDTVTKDSETGRFVTNHMEKEGPTNFIVTTTSLKIHFENETRNWSIDIDESDDQTQAVKDIIAEKYENPAILSGVNTLPNTFQLAQGMLKAYPVKIPFAKFLSSRTPKRPLRIRRDFPKLLSAIESIALLHQYQREIKQESGVQYIEARLEDYYMAKKLLEDVFALGLSGTNRKTQKAINAVYNIYQGNGGVPVTFKELIKELNRDKKTIQTWLNPAINGGEVEVQDSKGKNPTSFIPGIKRAKVSVLLPTVEELAQAFPNLVGGFRVVDPRTGDEVVLE